MALLGINKVILIGNLGSDPELRHTPSGVSVANFRIATNEVWIKQDGEREERTEWHTIVAWRKLAEMCGEYLSKGKQVYVEGKIRTRSWEDKDGNRRYVTEIVADNIQMLGSKDKPAGDSSPQSMDFPSEDDIPF